MIFQTLRCLPQKLQQRPDHPFTGEQERRLPSLFLLLVFLWAVLWTVLPTVCIGNISIDVAENLAWAKHFEFGYDKNPYFGAWLTRAFYALTWSDWISYLASQISVAGSLVCCYLLGKRIFHNTFHAMLSALLLLLNPFFSHSAVEFNDDVIEIGLWAATALFFHRAVSERDAGTDWLLTGLFAGLSMMTKYLGGAFLLPLGLLLLLTPEGRRCWKNPFLYGGIAVFLLLLLPNVFWLYEHDFISFAYALERAGVSEDSVSILQRLLSAGNLLGDFLGRLILPVVFLMFFFRRNGKTGASAFDQVFLWMTAAGPFVLSVLFVLFSGGEVLGSWLTPYFIASGLLLVMLWNPKSDRMSFRYFLAALGGFSILLCFYFGYEYLYKRPYLWNRLSFNVYPGREAADLITAQWRETYGTPLPCVVAPRTEACNLYYYSPDRPEVFFDGDPRLSPWIDVNKVRKTGAVMVWSKGNPERFFDAPQWWSKLYRTNFRVLKLKRSTVCWFHSLAENNEKNAVIYVIDIPPQPQRNNAEQ